MIAPVRKNQILGKFQPTTQETQYCNIWKWNLQLVTAEEKQYLQLPLLVVPTKSKVINSLKKTQLERWRESQIARMRKENNEQLLK